MSEEKDLMLKNNTEAKLYKKIMIKVYITIIIVAITMLALTLMWRQKTLPFNLDIGTIGIIIGFLGVIATLVIGFYQTNKSLEIAVEDREITRISEINYAKSLLMALERELRQNQNIFTSVTEILKNYEKTLEVPYIVYSIEMLNSNLEKNTLRFNEGLFQSTLNLRDFFIVANNTFEVMRNPATDVASRKKLASSLYQEQLKQTEPFGTYLSALGKYTNEYEDSANDLHKSLREGTILLPGIYEGRLALYNSGGEKAYDIWIEMKFDNFTDYKIEDKNTTVASDMRVTWQLPTPSQINDSKFGEIQFTYKSDHSKKTKKETIKIEWNSSLNLWQLKEISSPNLYIETDDTVSVTRIKKEQDQ